MLADQFMQFLPVRCLLDKRELHHLHVAEIIEVVVLVPHVSHAATHSGSEITSSFSQYHDPSSGHVFATVVAYTLYHGLHTGIADGEAFAHPSVDIYLAVSSAIQQGVSGDGILFRIEIAAHGGQYRNASAAQSFSQVVIRFAFQLETDAVGQERTETLACRTFEFDVDGLFRKSCLPVFLGNRPCQHGAYRTVRIGDGVFQGNLFSVFYGIPGGGQYGYILYMGDVVLLFHDMVYGSSVVHPV